MDDDDVDVPEAFARMRRFADDNPGKIGIFADEVTVRVRPIRNPVRRLYVRARYRAALGTRLRALRARLGA
jgi:hypothetical protein